VEGTKSKKKASQRLQAWGADRVQRPEKKVPSNPQGKGGGGKATTVEGGTQKKKGNTNRRRKHHSTRKKNETLQKRKRHTEKGEGDRAARKQG